MSITLHKINNVSIKPIPQILMGAGDTRLAKGYQLFPEPYNNIFIVARKKSGKTTVIFDIVRRCASKKTNVVVFASTVHKDKSYVAIKEYCNQKDIPFVGYTSITEDNVLANIMDSLKDPDEDEEAPKKKPAIDMYGLRFDETKEKRDKYIVPEYIFIFDDLSNEMRNKYVSKLLKTNRHYKCKVILSSQYVHDILPDSAKQIDNWLLFGGLHEEKLKLIYQYADLSIEFNNFEDIYENATEAKYNFLYIDTSNDELRKNFNSRYENII